MTTEGGYPSLEQLSAEAQPLVIEGNALTEWSRHNDQELSNQRNALNLNNQHVRLTLWSMVYLVLATMQLYANYYQYLLFDNRDNNSWWWYWGGNRDDEMEYYSLGTSANSIIQFAVVILF